MIMSTLCRNFSVQHGIKYNKFITFNYMAFVELILAEKVQLLESNNVNYWKKRNKTEPQLEG